MKNLSSKKTQSKDKGVAIIVSMSLLVIFFLLGFGFMGASISANSNASIRSAVTSTETAATKTLVYEAMEALEARAFNGADAQDFTMFDDFIFTNGTAGKNITVRAFGTFSNNNTDLENYLKPQLEPDNTEYIIETNLTDNPNLNNFGWIETRDINGDGATDRYAWLAYESNGLDVNYLGGNTAGDDDKKVTNDRQGIYTRELNLNSVFSGYDSLFVSWFEDNATTYPDSDTAWQSKKRLLTATQLGTDYEHAADVLEVGTSSVEIREQTESATMIDLARGDIASTEFWNPGASHPGLSYFTSQTPGAAANQRVANLTDFCDSDNYATIFTDAGPGALAGANAMVGNERVPYINEIVIGVQNKTEKADPADTTCVTTVLLDGYIELVKMHNATANWGTTDGTNAHAVVNITITYDRDGETDLTLDADIDISTNLSNSDNGYIYFEKTGVSVSSATAYDAVDVDLANLSVTLNSVTLYGIAGTSEATIWDYAQPNAEAEHPSGLLFDNKDHCGFEVSDPRFNQLSGSWSVNDIGGYQFTANFTDADLKTFPTALATTQTSSNNNSWAPQTEGEETAGTAPWQISTAHMPENGQINHLVELGCIHRGDSAFRTLNLVDYNMSTPFVDSYKPTSASLDLSNTNGTFTAGDRSLLDEVFLSQRGANLSSSATPTIAFQYRQVGSINANTTNQRVIDVLLDNITPLYGHTNNTSSAISITDTDGNETYADNFPGIEAITDNFFAYNDFHDDSLADEDHTRNPRTLGYPFSTGHPDDGTDPAITDFNRETLLMANIKLLNTRYSYFTVLTAIIDGRTQASSKARAFIRRDNSLTADPIYRIINISSE